MNKEIDHFLNTVTDMSLKEIIRYTISIFQKSWPKFRMKIFSKDFAIPKNFKYVIDNEFHSGNGTIISIFRDVEEDQDLTILDFRGKLEFFIDINRISSFFAGFDNQYYNKYEDKFFFINGMKFGSLVFKDKMRYENL